MHRILPYYYYLLLTITQIITPSFGLMPHTKNAIYSPPFIYNPNFASKYHNRYILMKSLIPLLLALLITNTLSAPTYISMSYCGFGDNFCGESSTNDVYSGSSSVLLSYALIATNGAIIV